MKNNQLNIRLSDEEVTRFQAVAESLGLSVASALRHVMKREADRLDVAKKKTTKKKSAKT